MTDTGLRREVNEDSFVAQAPIFAVADGMGGHAAGDFASAAVVTRLAEHGGKVAMGTPEIDASLRLAVQDMGRGAGVTDEGSGTTVTGAALGAISDEPAWIVFNIGDSRVYRLVGGVLEQLTVDHSIVQELVDAGPDHAGGGRHPSALQRDHARGRLPRGADPRLPRDRGRGGHAAADLLRRAHEGAHVLRHPPLPGRERRSPSKAARQLVEAALGNGGRDNVTVVVVDVLKVVRPEQRPTTGAAPTATSTDGCRGRAPRRTCTRRCRGRPAHRAIYNGGHRAPPGHRRRRGVRALGGS